MRLSLSGGRLEVVTADGRHVRYPAGLLALPLLPFVAAAVAFLAFADRQDGATLGHDLRVALTNLTTAEPVARDSAIPTIALVIPENTLVEMERALHRGDPALRHDPGGDRPFLNALFLEGNNPIACEIALLAPPGHHDPEKPSLRIKFRKGDAQGGERRIDLYRPEDPLAIEAWRYASLARELDLIHDAASLVRLFVNRKPFGVYHRSLAPGPAMSHLARRLPGTFVFSSPGRDAWADASAWQRFGTDLVAPMPIEELIRLLAAGRSPETTAELEHLVDFESLARWAAVRAVLGRSEYDGEQLCLFFAEGDGRIEAVAWPFDGTTGAADSPIGSGANRLLARLEQEPEWTSRRDSWIAELLGHRLPGVEGELVQAPDLATDLHLVERRGELLHPVSVSELGLFRARDAAWVEQRSAVLRAHVAGARPEETQPVPPALELGPGAVELTSNVVTAPGQPLVIRAGTRIALHGGVGIYAHGPTTVAGTDDAPVVLRSASWEPWAAFALIGPLTRGSRIAWLDTQDGSVGVLHHQKLAAGFAVHDGADVEVVHSRFGPSAPEGDSVHLTRAGVRFTSCIFEDARGDALDAMFSTVQVGDCRFIVAARNGLDLCASRCEVEGSYFDCALRAAVSVGEGSRATVTGTVLQRSDFGLDAHDSGRTLLREVRFQSNRIGLWCEHRDWRHDEGGSVALEGALFYSNRDGDLSIGSRSDVLLLGSGQPSVILGDHRIQHVDAITAGWLER